METATKYDVKEVVWAEKTFVVKRAKVGFDKLTKFFSDSYGEIYDAIKKSGMKAGEYPCAIYYSVDEVKLETDLAAAVPIQNAEQDFKGFEKVTIPKAKALLITYYGSYENMSSAYSALEKHLTDHGLKKEWMIEEYFSDPAVEKDPAKWKTNIYFVLK